MKVDSSGETGRKHVVFAFYSADYREVHRRMVERLPETYHAHNYSLNVMAEVGRNHGQATVLACHPSEPYEQRIDDSLAFVGAGPDDLVATVDRLQPTHLVLKAPERDLMAWARKTQTPTAAVLADSFPNRSIRRRLWNRLLVRDLNNSTFEWVANHGRTSTKALAELGVAADKLIAWDWPHVWAGHEPKEIRPNKPEYSAIYVGSLTATKGVGDLITAASELRSRGMTLNLSIAGGGDRRQFEELARDCGVQDQVRFLGLVDHSSIVARMRASDFVVVPSRHEYPEGFPLTIYEAVNSRSVLVASDHPMFTQMLHHDQNALLFPASDATALADQLERAADPDRYAQLSSEAHNTWQTLQLPVIWGDLIGRWLEGTDAATAWLENQTLASLPAATSRHEV